jgi:hypothetical protein
MRKINFSQSPFSSNNAVKRSVQALAMSAFLMLPAFALASNSHDGHSKSKEKEVVVPADKVLEPATRYSGATAIDLSNGIPFNNGTYGLPNAAYEEISKSLTAVGISEKPYVYERRDGFLSAYADRLAFFETALVNWSHKSEYTKPEAVDYGKEATGVITPRLEKAKQAYATANHASESNWADAQNEARHALVDLQAAYYGLHRNPAHAGQKMPAGNG